MAMPQQAPPKGPPQQKGPDPNNPDDMIGYIDPNASPKVQTFLLAAKRILISGQGAQTIKGLLGQSQGDPVTPIAALVAQTIEKLQDKLGPLNDNEHDQVAMHMVGWVVSSLQKMGMPGLDDAGARQDLIGRIMQTMDGMTRGDSQGDHGQSQPMNAQTPSGNQGGPVMGGGGGAPMQQFAGGGP